MVLLYRGLFVQLCFVVPVGICWLSGVRPILMALGQNAVISEMTSVSEPWISSMYCYVWTLVWLMTPVCCADLFTDIGPRALVVLYQLDYHCMAPGYRIGIYSSMYRWRRASFARAFKLFFHPHSGVGLPRECCGYCFLPVSSTDNHFDVFIWYLEWPEPSPLQHCSCSSRKNVYLLTSVGWNEVGCRLAWWHQDIFGSGDSGHCGHNRMVGFRNINFSIRKVTAISWSCS